jgi:hypothetical protein
MKFVLTHEQLNKRYVHHNADCSMVRRHGSSYMQEETRVPPGERAGYSAKGRVRCGPPARRPSYSSALSDAPVVRSRFGGKQASQPGSARNSRPGRGEGKSKVSGGGRIVLNRRP